MNQQQNEAFKQLSGMANAASNTVKQRGKDLFQRTYAINQTVDIQKKYQLWLYCKTALQTPAATTKGHDIYGNIFEGPNFATQDYLGLATNPESKEIAVNTIKEFGLHSGGAALAFGTHPWFIDLQREIAEFWGVENVILFPTGWMGGFGVVKGLMRPFDHIIMDRLAHNCLQEGAKAATEQIHIVDHLDTEALIAKIREVRAADGENAILVITESLFSMDSDTPDLVLIQKECKKNQAFLLIDMAHDFGSVGKKGLGALETQGLTDISNVILMGSGSKTLSSNVGFVGCADSRVIEYLRYFSSPYMFSNVAAPPQCAVALNNLRIVKSEEGERLREKVMNNSLYLRDQLTKKGYEVLGNPSPIVILIVGDELLTRVVARFMLNNGVVINSVEFPIVPKGRARLRLQLQATHTKEHLDLFVEKFIDSFKQAEGILKSSQAVTSFANAKL